MRDQHHHAPVLLGHQRVRALFAGIIATTVLVGLTGSAGVADSGWTKVSAGQDHACAIRSTRLYCWGFDNGGQVGNGGALGDDTVNSPQQIGSSTEWTDVSAGGYHSCGIRSTRLYCWGNDSEGQLGNGSPSGAVLSPQQIGSLTGWTDVDLGHNHSCGLRSGRLYCWGDDSNGRIGNGTSPLQPLNVRSPERIGSAADWTAVSAGSLHTCGIRKGALYCWGGDSHGQLGNGVALGNKSSPVKIGLAADWTYVAAGNNHTCGIRASRLYCWGNDEYQEIGNGSFGFAPQNVTSPVLIGPLRLTGWTNVTAEHVHTCGIRSGLLHCWGKDTDGQLGNGSPLLETVASPQRIGSDAPWTEVSAGDYYTCGIRSTRLYCWGASSATPDLYTPTEIG